MNYFIDFDHTLYNTKLLTNDMLDILAKYISNISTKKYDDIIYLLTEKFKRGENKIYDIYELITFFSKEYNFEKTLAIDLINKLILNGSKYVYDDSIHFLQNIKNQGNNIYILSYNENKVYFQTIKIAGSGLLDYIDGVFSTINCKCDIPFDFSNCIFIDDKPKELLSIYEQHPFGIYRIRRPNDTYSHIDTNLPIPEFSSLDEFLRKEC